MVRIGPDIHFFIIQVAYFEAKDVAGTRWQLGYVRVHLAFVCDNIKYLFVRWYTDRRKGIESAPFGTTDNRFANSHIRNLPALAWSPLNKSNMESYDILPVRSLWKAAWVVNDNHDSTLWVHLKHPKLLMHQDRDSAFEMT